MQVIWHLCQGLWDMALLEDTLKQVNPDTPGTVFIFPAGLCRGEIEQINALIAQYPSVLVIATSDEERSFPVQLLKHTNMKLWLQYARLNDHADRFFPLGYTHEAPRYAKGLALRHLNWFFSGQVTHSRREECVQQLRLLTGGILNETKGFAQGLPAADYFNLMSQSKIVPCPSGPCSVDSFRLYEALECGCVPIVDNCTPGRDDTGIWQKLFGQSFPMPQVNDWTMLPTIMNEELHAWPANAEKYSAWWKEVKLNLVKNMEADLNELHEQE